MQDVSHPPGGRLFLVVGPSGAGKDTLMIEARNSLTPDYVFPRRTITRPNHPGVEDHVSVTSYEFLGLELTRQFAMSWQAHNLNYGIPVAIERELREGRHVVVNVSRSVVQDVKARFDNVRVILVTAGREALASRLRSRGRDDAGDIAERLTREQPVEPDFIVVNDGSVESGVAKLLLALRS